MCYSQAVRFLRHNDDDEDRVTGSFDAPQLKGQGPGGMPQVTKGQGPGGIQQVTKGQGPGGMQQVTKGQGPGGMPQVTKGQGPGGMPQVTKGQGPGGMPQVTKGQIGLVIGDLWLLGLGTYDRRWRTGQR